MLERTRVGHERFNEKDERADLSGDYIQKGIDSFRVPQNCQTITHCK